MRPNKRPLLIGITGNIGTGKSSVCSLIEQQFTVVYADEVAKTILESQHCKDILFQRWGSKVLSKDAIDRVSIAKIVFQDPHELDFLNNLIHPLVLAIFETFVENATEEVLFFEVPLLFEANLAASFDFIVLITAERDIRIKRLLERDQTDVESITARIDAQLDDALKMHAVDHIIVNNGEPEELVQAVEQMLILALNCPPRQVDLFTEI
ncbi:MAG: dephospho-CoA kinase [Candidatus Cloacimonetes bacterium HGW-Cloacimonetes-1]|jgi:dephospho-CoA kinase|nr:MAG: dephospho-CoA kinase [Candidatus Cloacimonetes bacterium HGW-Cloacimonetes-1]